MTATQERLAKKQKVDGELTKARTQLAQMRYHREAMAVAERRGELNLIRFGTLFASSGSGLINTKLSPEACLNSAEGFWR